MTRINVGYNPQRLNSKMLIAEHREIKRIPNSVSSGKAKLEHIPESFRLGQGHVKFFYNKLYYLKKRYDRVHSECLRRGFNVQDFSSAWDNIPKNLMKDWNPTQEECEIIEERINNKLKKYL